MGESNNTENTQNTEVVEKEAKKKKESTQKKSFFSGVKSEFKMVSWPNRETLVKESVAVVVTSVILGVIIALVDLGVQYGFDKLLQLG